jgi:adenylylsulfate kinase-like enzyme
VEARIDWLLMQESEGLDPQQTRGVLIVTGVPGAGKTTVSGIVAQKLERSALIHGDQVHNLVVSGRRHPNEEPRAEADRQLRMRDRNIAALTDNLAAAGFLTVVDDVFVHRARLRRLLAFMRTRPVFLAVLAPSIEVVEARDAARPDKTVFHIWSHLDAVMREEISDLGMWLDSSELNAEETADRVLSEVWQAGRLSAGHLR